MTTCCGCVDMHQGRLQPVHVSMWPADKFMVAVCEMVPAGGGHILYFWN